MEEWSNNGSVFSFQSTLNIYNVFSITVNRKEVIKDSSLQISFFVWRIYWSECISPPNHIIIPCITIILVKNNKVFVYSWSHIHSQAHARRVCLSCGFLLSVQFVEQKNPTHKQSDLLLTRFVTLLVASQIRTDPHSYLQVILLHKCAVNKTHTGKLYRTTNSCKNLPLKVFHIWLFCETPSKNIYFSV